MNQREAEKYKMKKERIAQTVKNTTMPAALLTIDEVSQIMGIGKTKAYALRREGLPVIRVGRAIRVSSAKLQEWIEQHEQEY